VAVSIYAFAVDRDVNFRVASGIVFLAVTATVLLSLFGAK
jgi:hypothetical protein